MIDDPIRPRPTDNAFLGDLRGGVSEPTYSGALSFMRRRFSRDIEGVDAVIWGVPFDCATSNRPGTRFGPQALRRASAIFDGDPQFPSGLDPFDALTVVDWGDCSFDYRHLDQVPGLIEAQAGEILASGSQLITLGGDHSITLPLLRAHVAVHGPLALVQFDAHQDTWEADGGLSHGTFVTQAESEGLIDTGHSIQIGIRSIAPAYLSFDIDALDPAFAPGTGTPVAGGLASIDALMLLWALRDLDWRGMDIVEISPPYDHADITAIAGATVVQHYLQMLAEKAR